MPSLSDFHPQPQETALNVQGQQALAELLQSQAATKRLRQRLDSAVKRLTDTACQLNDRASERRTAYEQKRRRLQENGDEIDREEQTQYDAFQRTVNDLTEQMDRGIRGTIDGQIWLDNVPQALENVSSNTREISAVSEAQARRSRRQVPHSVDNEDDEESQDGNYSTAENQPQMQLDPSDAPSALLRNILSSSKTNWSSKTPTERYANNNDYVGFYRAVFDAKNPGDNAPPLPHASLWFAEEEGREKRTVAGSQARSGRSAEGEDSDVEVASERIRTICPITFLPFKDPWSSKKCPHSFEKHAIMDMIDNSTNYLPFTQSQTLELSRLKRDQRARREKEIGTPQVACPECSIKLIAADLAPNPVLQRKVNRILEAERKQKEADEEDEEEEDDDDDVQRGTQRRRPIGLGSSPPRRISTKAENIKNESAKGRLGRDQRLPWGTQTTTAEGATVMDLDDSDEEMSDE